ncbi:hypothetical protein BLS_005120 [Venturia inaequalis]|uniref:Uncharacterized protein n=1 Tax=Venturia inaequalis TaxID=5025 RepID=A0A8H3V0T4_VENIN|nr:hypothetical protein BLS_005120 [Venturia inaequalis]KAE9979123.1 hypothetical protein EG328_001064 [Venturia inaequalis]
MSTSLSPHDKMAAQLIQQRRPESSDKTEGTKKTRKGGCQKPKKWLRALKWTALAALGFLLLLRLLAIFPTNNDLQPTGKYEENNKTTIHPVLPPAEDPKITRLTAEDVKVIILTAENEYLKTKIVSQAKHHSPGSDFKVMVLRVGPDWIVAVVPQDPKQVAGAARLEKHSLEDVNKGLHTLYEMYAKAAAEKMDRAED